LEGTFRATTVAYDTISASHIEAGNGDVGVRDGGTEVTFSNKAYVNIENVNI